MDKAGGQDEDVPMKQHETRNASFERPKTWASEEMIGSKKR
jgi:hypothetical protein